MPKEKTTLTLETGIKSRASGFAGIVGESLSGVIEKALEQYLATPEAKRRLAAKMSLKEEGVSYGKGNVGSFFGIFRIPKYSLAQAGPATDFFVIPTDWDEWVYTSIDPEKRKGAFAAELRGDSMEPTFSPGDVAIAQAGIAPRPGQHVVAYIEGEGAVFKKLEWVDGDPEKGARLVSINPDYPSNIYPREKILWMWPVIKVEKNLK